MAIVVKTEKQVEAMREGGRITVGALREVLAAVEEGVTTAELNEIAEAFIVAAGGEPAFKRVSGYGFATCINLNEGVVHGLPSERKLKRGDILTVDLGTFYRGLNTDMARTVYVGDKRGAASEKIKLLEVGEEALRRAVGRCRSGNRVRDISAAMEVVLKRAGYAPVDVLVGHGVGEELHEEPQIPCLVTPGESSELVEGMTLAVEVIYSAGDSVLKVLPDGWTFVTADGSLSCLFEDTVLVTASGPIALTVLN